MDKSKDAAPKQGSGIAEVVKGRAKRLAGELGARPDLVVEGENDETRGLHQLRDRRKQTD